MAQTQLMQSSYTVTYLPETGTILTITDAAGHIRTNGEEVLPISEGCWMYGDLAVPICDQVEGYDDLSHEQQALFDLLYSQVFSGDVAAGKLSIRSFDLFYSLKTHSPALLTTVLFSLSILPYPFFRDSKQHRKPQCYVEHLVEILPCLILEVGALWKPLDAAMSRKTKRNLASKQRES